MEGNFRHAPRAVNCRERSAQKEGTVRADRIVRNMLTMLLALLVLMAAARPVQAELYYSSLSDRASIEDRADLLTDSEEDELLSLAGQIAKDSRIDVRLVTTDNANGKSTRNFSDDYFESLTDSYEGVCCCIDMDNREIYLTTEGSMIWIINDDRVDKILDDAYEYVSSGNYAGTLESMLQNIRSYIRKGVEQGTIQYDEDTGTYIRYEAPKGITPMEGLLSGILGLVTALGVFGGTKGKYQLKFPEKNNYSFRDNVHMKLNRKEDSFVRRFVTHRHIPKRSSGGGGGGSHTSTTHHTSSGHSAGGGGRKF